MSLDANTQPALTIARIDDLGDGHFLAEEAGDLDAIVSGFAASAEHDVAGRPGRPLHGGKQIAALAAGLLAELRIDRFENVRRWYGPDHVVDESVLHATATGRPFGLDGHGKRVEITMLHVFDFDAELISRESPWVDTASLHQQLTP
jgi:uncharacterized protein